MTAIEPHLDAESLKSLKGLRVLVVEDELLVAMEATTAMSGYGVKIVGPAPRVRAALEVVGNEPLDGAVLDVNLRGATSFEIADALAHRGVPFLFMTGYSRGILLPRFRNCLILSKPVMHAELAAAMVEVFVKQRLPCRS